MDMLTKLVPTLLDCYQRFRTNDTICHEIRQMFCTFLEHFRIAGVDSESKNVELVERYETLRLIKDSLG